MGYVLPFFFVRAQLLPCSIPLRFAHFNHLQGIPQCLLTVRISLLQQPLRSGVPVSANIATANVAARIQRILGTFDPHEDTGASETQLEVDIADDGLHIKAESASASA